MFLSPHQKNLGNTENYKEGSLQITHVYSVVLISTDDILMYFSETHALPSVYITYVSTRSAFFT